MQHLFKKRLNKLRDQLSSQPCSSALMLSSAAPALRSRTTFYPYRQNSNFFYLSGLQAKGLILIVSSYKQNRIKIFAPKTSAEQILWEGKPPSLNKFVQALDAELIISSNPANEARKYLAGHERLYYDNQPLTEAWKLTQSLMQLRPFERANFPSQFMHCENILAELRMFKEKEEIDAIKRSAKITYEALIKVTPLIRAGSSEADIAATVDYWFSLQNASPGFATIVGAGPSAATLHYEAHSRKLKDGEMLLIDCGAEHEMYCADVTRVFPIGGTFSPLQAQLYSIVLRAQKAAINKVIHGVKVKKVYDTAARELTIGLIELKILSGDLQRLLQKSAYRKYFPHGIGHTLGIDVHDLGNVRGNNQAVLKAGMVVTIEPGLYFPKPVRRLAACGIRIEDDVLVTRSKPEVLTRMIPKEIAEIESLLR